MKRHKYFRTKRYKQKLESKHNAMGRYSNVYFITTEPDPRAIREWQYFYGYNPRLIPGEWDKKRGRNYYEYYSRPEIAYTILEQAHGNSGYKTDLKKQSKNKLKTACQRNPELVFDKSVARKTCDRWHFD
jgi:hypothetical protein